MLNRIDYIEHAPDVIDRAARCIRANQRFALITSVAIEGGSARACGSLAIVTEDGVMSGYMSNGCIDRDIQFQALETLSDGQKRTLRYGQGSQFLDLQLPCGGALELLIDPAPDTKDLLAAADALTARQSVELRFDTGQSQHGFRYEPKFRLVIAGRGAVFRAVAHTAHDAGFELAALSPDEADLEAITPAISHPSVHLKSPGIRPCLPLLDAHSAFLTLFHDHDWEQELLLSALGTDARFIGSLGSRKTHAGRITGLMAAGASQDDCARIQGPIGLVPSLRDAKLIALSALAEIGGLEPNRITQLPDTALRASA